MEISRNHVNSQSIWMREAPVDSRKSVTCTECKLALYSSERNRGSEEFGCILAIPINNNRKTRNSQA